MQFGFKVQTSVIVIVALCATFYSVAFASSQEALFNSSIQIQTQSAYSRLLLALDESFKPVLKEVKGGFEVTIPHASLMDIGVPFGSEAEFKHYVSSMHDLRLSELRVDEVKNGLVVKGKYKFPTGAHALANPKMEQFEFRQSELGKYALDFWYQKGPTLVEASHVKKQKEVNELHSARDQILKYEQERVKIREKRIEDARNSSAFCEQPFDKKNIVFIRFRTDHPQLSFSAYFPENIPDHRHEYVLPKGNSEEVEMVKLAVKLSKENNHALAVKTVDFFEKEYPKSKFANEMYFLKANSFYRLGMEDKGRELLQEVVKRAKGTEIGLQSAAFLAVQAFNRKEWLFALNAFSTIRKDMPKHPLNWLFRYGIAECLYQIKQADQAHQEFEWVAEHAPKAQVRAESAFKAGDVYIERNQYAMAVQAYSKAIKNNESALNQYPNVLMNLAESFFQLEEYKRAEETFVKYLEHGKNHPNAWRASLRIAELKALNQKQNEASEKAFMATVNSYPMSPGAVISRMRLLPCGNHGGFDLTGMQRFMSSAEVQNFDTNESVFSTNYKELVSVTEVRAYLSFGEDEKGIESGIAHLRENPSFEVRKLIERAMVGGIKRLLAHQLEHDEGFKAISTYEKYGDYLPLPSYDPIADELRIKLAQFAAQKEFRGLALSIIDTYRHVDAVEQKEILKAIEKSLALDSSQDQEERIILSQKTIWNSDRLKMDDQAGIDSFLSKLSMIRDQSKYAFERDLLRSLLYHEKKEYSKAIESLGKISVRTLGLSNSEKAQAYFYLAETAKKSEQFIDAAQFYRQTRLLMAKVSDSNLKILNFRTLAPVPSISLLYANEGEMLEKDQKWKEAVALYEEAIENKVGGNRLLYAHAKAILKDGSRNAKITASRSLEKIKQSQEDDVWKNLALKTLEEFAKEGNTNDKTKP